MVPMGIRAHLIEQITQKRPGHGRHHRVLNTPGKVDTGRPARPGFPGQLTDMADMGQVRRHQAEILMQRLPGLIKVNRNNLFEMQGNGHGSIGQKNQPEHHPTVIRG